MASDRVKLIVEFDATGLFADAEKAKFYMLGMLDMFYPQQNPSVSIVPDPMHDLPHSRACGMRSHEHGPDCHPNCPTCGTNPNPLSKLGRVIDKDRAEHPTVNVTPDPLMLEVHTDYKRDF